MAAFVPNWVDLGGIGEYPPHTVAQDRIVLPASLPELVTHLHIFVGHVIPIVMRALTAKADILRPTIEIGGDDVPTRPSFGQVIERREAASESVGMLEGKGGGKSKAEILGHKRHRRHELQRIVDRDLGRMAQRRLEIAAINVVDAEHVGDEQAVELAALQDFGELDPIFEILVLPGTVARMCP